MSAKMTANISVEIWGTYEAARALGVSQATVRRWFLEDPKCPRPLAELKGGRVWLAADLRDYHRRLIQRRRKARAF